MPHRLRVPFIVAILLALAAPANQASQLTDSPAPRAGENPITASRFEISIDGVQIATFAELVALTEGYERDDLEISTDGGPVEVKLPGKIKPATLVLKRGKNNSIEMREWFDAAMADSFAARKSCTLTMFSYDGKAVTRYRLENAWPSKIEIGGLTTGSGTSLTETVTLVADSIREEPLR